MAGLVSAAEARRAHPTASAITPRALAAKIAGPSPDSVVTLKKAQPPQAERKGFTQGPSCASSGKLSLTARIDRTLVGLFAIEDEEGLPKRPLQNAPLGVKVGVGDVPASVL